MKTKVIIGLLIFVAFSCEKEEKPEPKVAPKLMWTIPSGDTIVPTIRVQTLYVEGDFDSVIIKINTDNRISTYNDKVVNNISYGTKGVFPITIRAWKDGLDTTKVIQVTTFESKVRGNVKVSPQKVTEGWNIFFQTIVASGKVYKTQNNMLGNYEMFVPQDLEYQKDSVMINYHVACRKNIAGTTRTYTYGKDTTIKRFLKSETIVIDMELDPYPQ